MLSGTKLVGTMSYNSTIRFSFLCLFLYLHHLHLYLYNLVQVQWGLKEDPFHFVIRTPPLEEPQVCH